MYLSVVVARLSIKFVYKSVDGSRCNSSNARFTSSISGRKRYDCLLVSITTLTKTKKYHYRINEWNDVFEWFILSLIMAFNK